MTKIVDKIDSLSDLISPHRDLQKPIYNWHSFKHSYSKALVDNLVHEFGLRKGSWVMDPFCGGGTTLLACKELGINSSGFDILPFSIFLSNVKTREYNLEKLSSEKKKFDRSKKISLHIPSLTNIPIAKKAFSTSVRNELIQIKQGIEEISDSTTRDFYNLGMLSILESVSNTSKSGGFLRIVEQRVRIGKVKEVFMNKIESMISDVQKFNEAMKWKNIDVSASYNDAREIDTERKYDAVITSPPYPNRHDYTRIYSLEMLFDFVKSNDDLKKIRYETLRSHVEARKKYNSGDYVKSARLCRLIGRINKNGTNNPRIGEMLEGYFEDMYLVMREMSKRVKKKGKIALVISNVRFAGVNIPVDEILSETGEQVGLKPRAIWVARYRGNSSQQMKEYKRKPSRESIILWEK
ncbi:MAG: DNA adenine methylase [Candidatus Omnitrophica bacterium]|nr:DNA adenine methylase [Candidatus Omnitrophota bacterium]